MEPPAPELEIKAQDGELLDPMPEKFEDDAKPMISQKQKQDPLRWFGVFVPQALRTSQKHFTESVEVIVSELSSIDSHMRALEIEIRRTRKQMSRLK